MQKLNLQEHSLALKKAFSMHDKKDFTIDCVLEGTMCSVFSDCQKSPAVFLIQNGPFHLLAGNAEHLKASALIELIPCGSTILPSPMAWIDKLKKYPTINLQQYSRYSLDHNNISIEHLDDILVSPNQVSTIQKIDTRLAKQVNESEDFNYHLQNFNSEEDFLIRGLGYVALDKGVIVGVASSALVCAKGIEINIMVLPNYRGLSLGKRLAASLIKASLSNNKIPHWDGANEISLKLAKSLGYDFVGKYNAYRI